MCKGSGNKSIAQPRLVFLCGWQVENLKHRTDISDEEREHRRKILMAEVAAGVVGAGVLGVAGYAAYQHHNKDDGNMKDMPEFAPQGGPPQGGPHKTSWFNEE